MRRFVLAAAAIALATGCALSHEPGEVTGELMTTCLYSGACSRIGVLVPQPDGCLMIPVSLCFGDFEVDGEGLSFSTATCNTRRELLDAVVTMEPIDAEGVVQVRWNHTEPILHIGADLVIHRGDEPRPVSIAPADVYGPITGC